MNRKVSHLPKSIWPSFGRICQNTTEYWSESSYLRNPTKKPDKRSWTYPSVDPRLHTRGIIAYASASFFGSVICVTKSCQSPETWIYQTYLSDHSFGHSCALYISHRSCILHEDVPIFPLKTPCAHLDATIIQKLVDTPKLSIAKHRPIGPKRRIGRLPIRSENHPQWKTTSPSERKNAEPYVMDHCNKDR